MDDARVAAEQTVELETSLTENGKSSSTPTDSKSKSLLVDDSKAEAQPCACDSPIDMSSPALLLNETQAAKNQVGNSADSHAGSIDSLLNGLVIDPAEPDLHIPACDPLVNQHTPVREVDLHEVGETQDSLTLASADNQHPTPFQELPKLDYTHNNGQQDTVLVINTDSYPASGVENTCQLIMATPEINTHSLKAEVHSSVNDGKVNSLQVPKSPIHQKSFSVDSPKYVNDSFGNRVVVDTAAPFDSVKEAVSKFGGIVDWKAHKIQTVERRKFIEQELDKAQEEVPIYRKMSQTAEEAKVKVLDELNNAKRLIEDMKLNVERAQTEEHQAKQDAELAKLRVEEMEQGIAEESSIAAKAQLEVAKARHSAAISDLQCAKDELEALRKEYAALIAERDRTVKKAEEAKAAAKEVEKTVQDLTIELISTKEALESAHAKHLEAEEGRLTAALAKEQNSRNWEKDLKEVQDEVAALSEQVLSATELQSKLDSALTSLRDLQSELANYKESKLNQIIAEEPQNGEQAKSLRGTHTGIQAAVASAQKELEDVRQNIEKAIEEVNLLKLAASSLESELEAEKATVAEQKQKEVTKSKIVQSLETEINQIELELAEAKIRETEAREKMMNLPMQLPQAAEEADRVKCQTQNAREELEKVKEESERAKAGVITMESRLVAAEREKEAARASENLALAAIKALQESENARSSTDATSPTGVVISLEEYYELSKRAQEAEEQANLRVATAIAEMEEMKETQLKSMEKLEQVEQEITQRKDALKIATQKAQKAAEGKLSLEQELRNWRESAEQIRKETEQPVIPVATDSSSKIPKSGVESSNYIRLPSESPPRMSTTSATETEASSPDIGKPTKKKKRSFFPRVLMFLAKRKTNSSR